MKWGGLGLVLAIAALAGLMRHRARPESTSGEAWLAEAPSRPLEARLSYPGADVYRPYDAARSRSAPPPPRLPMRVLAALEEAHDFHGLATAYLVHGNASQALTYLDSAGHSPDIDSDRALVALGRGDFEQALALLETVLTTDSAHPRALWNRGLALRELGLPMLAAESFSRVAALGEPGWSAEATWRAESLRRQVHEYRDAHAAATEAGKALRHGGPAPLDMARAFPGLLRLHFYDALRAAPTRERALELLPLAAVLDSHEGKDTVRALLHRVAARDFSRRAPLAREYERLLREGDAPADWAVLISEARQAGEEDILLGALLLGGAIRAHLEEYEALAARSGDDWFTLLAAHHRAQAEMVHGRFRQAEQVLLAALRTCATSPLDFRCAELEDDTCTVYSQLHRPADARAHALAGLRRARRSREWHRELALLQLLGQVARLNRTLPLAAAWYGEILARTPEDCVRGAHVHQTLAMTYQLALKPTQARTHLQQALRCGPLQKLSGVAVLAELARSSPSLDEDARHLQQAAQRLRASGGLDPGALTLLSHYEARLELERSRERGRALLRRNLEATAPLASQDVNARKARTASYTSLLLDAGRSGDWRAALALFSEEQGLSVPARCALAVAVDDERTLLVALGPGGEPHGHVDSSRTSPFQSAEGLVPAPLLEALRPCEAVVVLARPPVHGHAGLLPPEFAWSYHVARRAPLPAAVPTARHLVVADVEPPAGLELPRLNAWTPGAPDARRVVLSGPSATPRRVLAEMADATEIELHAHGLIDPEVSDASLVVLSAEPDGRYALTAREVRQQPLRSAPVVILGACRAAHTAPFLHEPFSLPVAFAEAGARAVFAATVDLPDAQAGPFFESIRSRIRAGTPPALALRDERLAWRQRPGADWVRHVLLFE